MNITYTKNLRFKCLKCGLCCGDTPEKERHVLLLKKEAEGISAMVKRPVSDFAVELANKAPYDYEMKKTERKGKCLFLQQNRCTIYPARPLVCRFYPFGLETSQNLKTFYFAKECLGIGKGKTMKEVDFKELVNLANRRIGTTRKGNSNSSNSS